MKLYYFTITVGMLLATYITCPIFGADYVVEATDEKYTIKADDYDWPGTNLDENTYIHRNGSIEHRYTDRVLITLDENRFFNVLFLSDNPREVSLQYTSPWGYFEQNGQHFKVNAIPDNIQYKGDLYKVVALEQTMIGNEELTIPGTIRYIESAITMTKVINFEEGLQTLGPDAIWECNELSEL